MLSVFSGRFHIGVYSFIVIFLLTGPNQHLIGFCNSGTLDGVETVARQVEYFCFGNGLQEVYPAPTLEVAGGIDSRAAF